MKSPHIPAKAVIFDLDGTITEPILDFARIKREIGAGETPILEFLASITDDEARRVARQKVDRWEREAAEASTLNPGVLEVLDALSSARIPVAVLTRNNRESVDTVAKKHALHFDVIVTADDRLPPKPSAEPVKYIARKLGLDPSEVVMVGDFAFDMTCGRSAGAHTVLLLNRRKPTNTSDADVVIGDLRELLDIIEVPHDGSPPEGRPGP